MKNEKPFLLPFAAGFLLATLLFSLGLNFYFVRLHLPVNGNPPAVNGAPAAATAVPAKSLDLNPVPAQESDVDSTSSNPQTTAIGGGSYLVKNGQSHAI